jgi:peptidoglycan/xylan/chitin deacetylase (PgdA/CDA1 family)
MTPKPSADVDRDQGSAPLAVVHVDLDGALEIFAAHGLSYTWDDDPIFESGLRNLLDFLDHNQLTATLFVIASSLDHPAKRRLLEDAVRRGHEVASHTLTHAYLRGLDPVRKRVEISESRGRLVSCLGVQVRGFRAPGYRIDREAVDLLAECGYEYDSSAFPTTDFAKHLRVDVDALRRPQRPFPGNPLIELPLPDHRPSPVPFTPSYALVMGRRYFRWGLERAARAGRPFVLLFHLIDLADPLPIDRQSGWKLRLFTLSSLSAAEKRRRCQEMLNWTRRHYRLTSTAALLSEHAASSRTL